MVPTARALLDSDGATIVLPNDVVLAALQKDPAAAAAEASSARPWYDRLQMHGTSPLTPSCCSKDAPCIPDDIFGVDPLPSTPPTVRQRHDCNVQHKWALTSTAEGPLFLHL